LEAVVDGLAAAAALTQDVPVVEAGDDVRADAAVFAVVVVVDDPVGVVALWTGDGGMSRYPPSPRITRRSSSCATVWRATMTSLRLPGLHWPATIARRR
jgi:hypothetical protein